MDKTQHPTIQIKNIYAFIDPSAKGTDRGIFHLFVAGKDGFGMFMHNGKKYFLDELKDNPQKIIYYSLRNGTNLNKSYCAQASNNIAKIFESNFISIKGIEKDAIEAIQPIKDEVKITLSTCRLYENLFSCVQKRIKENKTTVQKTLDDFCM